MGPCPEEREESEPREFERGSDCFWECGVPSRTVPSDYLSTGGATMSHLRRVKNTKGKEGVAIAVSPRGGSICVFYDGQEYGTSGIWESKNEVTYLDEAPPPDPETKYSAYL